MSKKLFTALSAILISFTAAYAVGPAPDSPPSMLPNGGFISSCGIVQYTVVPNTESFTSMEDAINFYRQLNYDLCGTYDGWIITWRNMMCTENDLRNCPNEDNPFAS